MSEHISDRELLQLADGELVGQRSSEVNAHLADCGKCLERYGELQSASADFLDARAALLNGRVRPGDAAATRFEARLDSLVAAPAPRREWAMPAVALIAAMLLAGFLWIQRAANEEMKPDARLTPGAALTLSRDEVCAVPDADDVQVVPASLAGQVFTSYGIRPKPRTYEVDYLIAPALGGATDVRNLWPQPYAAGVWNSRVKDALEDHLRHLVCEGRVPLSTAQHEIATDWIAAYRKYFQTDRPLAGHVNFQKDHAWE